MEGNPSHYIEDIFVVANVKIDSIRSLIASEDKIASSSIS